MSRTYKWGILGPGTIAHKFTAGLMAIPGQAELYAVGSRDKGRAETFASRYGFKKAYGSYKELVEDPEVEIIYVATPHPQHEEAAILCLNQGKAVICEKPFAANKAQAGRMIEAAQKNKAFLMEAMWTRFLPVMVKTRELISSGAIGQVRLLHADFGFRTEVNPQGRLFALEYAGGSLLDVGIYNLSLASMIFGTQPRFVQSKMQIGSTGVDEECSLLLGYGDGQSALLFSAIRLATRHGAVIVGDSGSISLPSYWNGTKIILQNAEGTQEIDLPFEASGYQFEAQEVMQCLDKGLIESPLMPLKETMALMETMDSIRWDNKLRFPFDED